MPWEILRRDSPSHPGRLDVRVIVDEDKVISMSRESLQMLEDGLWLIGVALRGEAQDGPLLTPNGLPVR